MKYYIKRSALADDKTLERFIELDDLKRKISDMRSRYGSLMRDRKSLEQQISLKKLPLKKIDGSPLEGESERKERELQSKILEGELKTWDASHKNYFSLPVEIARLEEKEKSLESSLSQYQAIEFSEMRK